MARARDASATSCFLCFSTVPSSTLDAPAAHVRSAAMVKDKTTALERAKKETTTTKGKKTARGTSSRSGLPPGWI